MRATLFGTIILVGILLPSVSEAQLFTLSVPPESVRPQTIPMCFHPGRMYTITFQGEDAIGILLDDDEVLLMLDTTDPIDRERAVSVQTELCAFVFAAKNAAATPAVLTIRSSENVETSTGGISDQPHYRFRSIFDNDCASEREGGHSFGRLKPTFRQGQGADGGDVNAPMPDPGRGGGR